MTYYKTYDNGLRLVIKKMDGVFSVTTGILVGTGSRNENDKNNGISHAIEHMLFKGTTKRTAFDISDEIDGIGGQMNAFTTKEMTCFYTKTTGDHLEKAMDVLSDMFFNSTFNAEDFEKEKKVICEEINMCEDTPDDVVTDLLFDAYYGKDGLGRTILGPAENIMSFTKDDILKYMSERYTPDNVVIALAGNVDIHEAEDLVEKYFGGGYLGKTKQVTSEIHTFPYSDIFKYKDIEQAHLCIGLNGCPLDGETADGINVISLALGGGMSSRLFQRVREQLGLAYSVYSYPSSYVDTGMLTVYAGVNPQNRQKAFETIMSELKKFAAEYITESEFKRTKEQVRGTYILGQESTASVMLLYGKYLLFTGKKYDMEKRLADYKNMNFDYLKACIDKTFDFSKVATSTIGREKSALR